MACSALKLFFPRQCDLNVLKAWHSSQEMLKISNKIIIEEITDRPLPKIIENLGHVKPNFISPFGINEVKILKQRPQV